MLVYQRVRWKFMATVETCVFLEKVLESYGQLNLTNTNIWKQSHHKFNESINRSMSIDSINIYQYIYQWIYDLLVSLAEAKNFAILQIW